MHIKFTGGIPNQKAFTLRRDDDEEIDVYWGEDGKPDMPLEWCKGHDVYISVYDQGSGKS